MADPDEPGEPGGTGPGADAARLLLFTGKGGVGKTTTAASTAVLAADSGHRTLVLSTDPAHSLADALADPEDQGRPSPAGGGAPDRSGEPWRAGERLWVQQVDAQRRFEESWGEIQGYLRTVLDAVGVDPITAEELTVLPGAEEVLALLELRRHVLSGSWDVVVVDCAPTAETLRLLALPEALGWYMNRVFGAQRRVVRALRPVLTRAAGVPMPEDDVFDAVARLHRDLEQVQRLLTAPRATVRVVLTPEQVVLAEARRSLTTLSLYGYRVDGVIANRVFPAGADDPWMAGWAAAQDSVLTEVRESFAGLPVHLGVYQPGEPVGVEALRAFGAALYDGRDPLALPEGGGPLSVERSGAETVLRIALPFARRHDVDLARHGEELVVTVGSHRRLLALPQLLARRRVLGARVEGGSLQVRFGDEEAT